MTTVTAPAGQRSHPVSIRERHRFPREIFSGRLALLTTTPGLNDRLRAAISSSAQLERRHDWQALVEWCQAAPCGSVAVVDAFHGVPERDRVAPALLELLANAPLTAFVVTLNPGDQLRKELLLCRKLPVSEFIALEHDDSPHALRGRLRNAAAHPVRRLLAGALPPHLSGRARAVFDAAGEVASQGGDGTELCRRLGVSRRTLLRWANEEGLPPPRRLLAWIRVLMASALLDGSPRARIVTIARACGYTTDSALGRAMLELVGEKPSTLRRRGAGARVAGAFRNAVSGH